MSVKIVSRAEWGAVEWETTPHSIPMSERTEFFVHYHGAPPRHSVGPAVVKEVEDIHLANGWSGVGYNFLVDQDGTVFEGRGWSLVGAHCPNHNRSGISVYVAIGGDQEPSAAALASVKALYNEACGRAGKKLQPMGHRDGKATACPGDKLYAWVKAGMPVAAPEKPAKPPRKPASTKPTPKPASKPEKPQRVDLVVDGELGPKTIARLQEDLAVPVTKTLDKRTVEALQKWLNGWGHGLRRDGVFGPRTKASLQRYLGVRPDADFGPVSIRALQRRLNEGHI